MKKTLFAAAALLLLAAATGARAQVPGSTELPGSPKWAAYVAALKSGIVCVDTTTTPPFIKCSDGIEKAMREAAAQLPPLPKGVVIEFELFGQSTPDSKRLGSNALNYSGMVTVDDSTGVRHRSVGYARFLHCMKTQEEACGRSAIYRGYLEWEKAGVVAEGAEDMKE